MTLEQSILKCVKKKLGLDADYEAFDEDVLTSINTAFFTLNQLGLGPADGFMVEGDDEEWDDFTGGRINLNAVKSYIYLCARMEFDPPGTPHHISAIKDQKLELEHRLRMDREITAWGLDPETDLMTP
jgi:hypothetical protein